VVDDLCFYLKDRRTKYVLVDVFMIFYMDMCTNTCECTYVITYLMYIIFLLTS
jgi:hypothetical protein